MQLPAVPFGPPLENFKRRHLKYLPEIVVKKLLESFQEEFLSTEGEEDKTERPEMDLPPTYSSDDDDDDDVDEEEGGKKPEPEM